MDKKTISGSKIAEIAQKMVALLEPLSSEDRRKVIKGSLALLGEAPTGGETVSEASGSTGQSAIEGGNKLDSLPAKAISWMKANKLTADQIEQVFDITSGGVTIIAGEVPGKSKREQTHNAYLLQGVIRLLASGDTAFDDRSAREVCETLGCFDNGNHAKFMSDKGNSLTGSKGSGWKLTAPGLKRGADLVKQLTEEE